MKDTYQLSKADTASIDKLRVVVSKALDDAVHGGKATSFGNVVTETKGGVRSTTITVVVESEEPTKTWWVRESGPHELYATTTKPHMLTNVVAYGPYQAKTGREAIDVYYREVRKWGPKEGGV